MVETGYSDPKNVIFPLGITDRVEKNVEVAIYPGRLVMVGTTGFDAKPTNCLKEPIGYADYERVNMIDKPATMTTAYATSVTAPICSAVGKPVFMPTGLPIGFKAEEGDYAIPWGTAGQVAPAVEIGGKIALKVPFVKKTSVFDTGIDFPGGILIPDALIDVSTAASGATIDVGFINAVESGDEDGLLDGEAAATTGLQTHITVDATAGNITLGAYLKSVLAEANGGSATNLAVQKKYLTDGTIKSLCYTTSNHTITGWIYIFVESPGLVKVGKFKYAVDATSAAQNCMLMSEI